MKTIFYVYNPCWRLWPKRAEGVCRSARRRGWNVEFVVTLEDEKVVQEYFDFFRPVGCIVESSPTPQIDGICVRRGIPIVVCDGGGGGGAARWCRRRTRPRCGRWRSLSGSGRTASRARGCR